MKYLKTTTAVAAVALASATFMLLTSFSPAYEANATPGTTYTTTVSEDATVAEYADALGLHLENEAVMTAPTMGL